MPSWVLLFLLCGAADDSPAPPPRRDVVVVTGTYDPVPLEEADRAVRALPVGAAERLLSSSFADFLRLDSSFDLRARAGNGVQGDLSIRGGTFGQTLVLVDGLRMNDAQTGHHNLDLPLPLYTISQIELLKGAGSAYYGSDAVGGVVNVITRAPEATEFRLRAALGSFGVNEQSGSAAAVWRNLTQQFAFSRDFSSGFLADRDYRNLSLASITRARTRLGATYLTLAHNDRPFGADQFYGRFNSWERTRTWYAAARQELGRRTEVSFAYRRHTDLFVLYRDRPDIYTNRHAVQSAQAAVRRRETLPRRFTLSYGAEAYRDAIVSGNLGDHTRTRGALYAALDARALGRFSFTVGGREELYDGGRRQFSPTVNAGFWASQRLRFRGGVSHAFRLPNYTDLYYHDPANVGSPNLRPEKAWSYETGLDWNAGSRLRGDLTVFARRERDGIDYIRYSPTDVWRAANFARRNFAGLETSVALAPARGQRIELRYSALRGTEETAKFAYNYPVHSGVALWEAALPKALAARLRLGALNRRGRDPYALWDSSLAYTRGRLRPFFQLANITAVRYEEIQGVVMPGRAVTGGVEVVLVGR
jgi:iron complex outermembrane receptor protein